jgi:hypothetical protein
MTTLIVTMNFFAPSSLRSKGPAKHGISVQAVTRKGTSSSLSIWRTMFSSDYLTGNMSGASRPLPLITKELEYKTWEGQALRIYFRNDKSLFADISKIIFSIINEYYNEASQTPLKTGAVISYQY